MADDQLDEMHVSGGTLLCGFCGRKPEEHSDSDAGPMSVCPQLDTRAIPGGLTADQVEFVVEWLDESIENKVAHGGNPAWLEQIKAVVSQLDGTADIGGPDS
jgi:hypothetical protein